MNKIIIPLNGKIESDHKKFIGNSVVPQVVKCWVESMAQKLIDNLKTKSA